MNKAHTAKQPSIEDLLASIRQAIHDDVAPSDTTGSRHEERLRSGGPRLDPNAEPIAGANKAAETPSPTSQPVRPEAEHRPLQRTIVTSGGQGFAGLLGGDVRLEEALARLSHAGRRPAVAPQSSEPPRLRPAIEEPVERLQAEAERPGRSGAGEVSEPPEQSHERSDARPPWLASERSADTDRAAGPIHDSAPPAADPLWGDAHASRQHALPPPDAAREARGSAAESDLLSSEAAAAASSAFNRLADAIVQRSTGGERSLEEVTRELLRPMLKSWLDHNLPRMVEQLVREEIARVARNGK